MKEFWNKRYGQSDFAYGEEPNTYFKEKINSLSAGKLLLPAEGEGRNAVYAAQKTWQVTAFDMSEAGKEKALQLADKKGVKVDYLVGNALDIKLPNEFDAMALIFSHFPPDIKTTINQRMLSHVKVGGAVIIEVFSKDHLQLSAENPKAGGPKNIEMLYTVEDLISTFPQVKWTELSQEDVELSEGVYHIGSSSVVRGFGIKMKD